MSNNHNNTGENPNDFQRGYYGEKNFALTGKIMMSAIIILFTVVLLILCLHIYARWLLLRSRRNHRRRRTDFVFSGEDNGQIPTTNPAQRGLELSTLQSLPIFVFTTSTHKDGLECSVCLCEFEENEKGRVLPKCKHSFHIDCIDMWFHSHSTCPLCRTAVKPYFPAPGNLTSVLGQIPVEEALEASPSHVELCSSCRPGEESSSSSSLGVKGSISEEVGSSSSSSTCSSSSLQKGWAITVEVPRRTESFRVPGDDSAISPGLKSSMSRMLSLKRILSRDRKASLGVSFSFSSETDLEQGGGEHR